MATITKFYFHDATSPNTGTMPSGALLTDRSGGTAVTGDATGARTARDATDVIGTANPDIESTVTATANTLAQTWGHRRFVSRPLATQTVNLSGTGGSWTVSYAQTESNVNHNQAIFLMIYCWRPSTGARVGSGFGATYFLGSEPSVAGTEEGLQTSNQGSSTDVAILDGDILVFDFTTQFTQLMGTAYTEQFAYDGNDENSITSRASYVTPPFATPLTLFAPRAKQSSVVGQAVKRSSVWMKSHSGIVVPRLWTPADPLGV